MSNASLREVFKGSSPQHFCQNPDKPLPDAPQIFPREEESSSSSLKRIRDREGKLWYCYCYCFCFFAGHGGPTLSQRLQEQHNGQF